ncbi:epimerase [Cryobacterium luteum]|uniref:epimerase n=1 Tax=Cryobacterium luteum TaxID=1424661 RepID=UPI0008CC055B|nr:DUF1731 domain-containing protein [Cryobacterium luteum]SEN67320.1 hypothetical protein SAMN05216281_11178 [Cryobacterium luteum]
MGNIRGRAVIAGATGFIGRRLVRELRDQGYDVVCIGRNGPDARWDNASAVRALVDGSELVVNLAGKSVNCRYTDRNRDEILRSRIDSTRQLGEAIESSAAPPRVWLNASTATIYRYSLDRPMTEATGDIGTGFSVDIAQAWEAEFYSRELATTRRVALRMAIVLGDGPATATLVRLARIGLGGPQVDGWWFPHRRYRGIGANPTGSRTRTHHSRGRQKFSWIHIDDVVKAVKFIVENDALDGPVNLSAPRISDNRTLMATLRRRVGAAVGLPAFRWMLEPAMLILRTEPELVLKSRWVTPERLLQAGYTFTWPDLGPAINDVVKR